MYADDEEPMHINSEYTLDIPYSNAFADSNLIIESEPLTPQNHSDTTSITQDISSKGDASQEIKLNPESCFIPFIMPYKLSEPIVPSPIKNTRLKKKIIKAKSRNKSTDDPEKSLITKKQQQMIRNRIAAQESRNRKKKEIEDLQSENSRLKAENEILRQQLLHKQTQINSIYEVADQLSTEAKQEFENKRKGLTNTALRRPFPIFRLPVLVSAVVVGVICFACLFGLYGQQSELVKESIPIIHQQIDDGSIKLAMQESTPTTPRIKAEQLHSSESMSIMEVFKELDEDSKNQVCRQCKALDILHK